LRYAVFTALGNLFDSRRNEFGTSKYKQRTRCSRQSLEVEVASGMVVDVVERNKRQ
jgi:hypothetical protein